MNTIVTVCPFEGALYIFCSDGGVWVMYKDFVSGEIQFRKFATLFPMS